MYGVNHEEAEYQLTDWQDEKINIDGHFHHHESITGGGSL